MLIYSAFHMSDFVRWWGKSRFYGFICLWNGVIWLAMTVGMVITDISAWGDTLVSWWLSFAQTDLQGCRTQCVSRKTKTPCRSTIAIGLHAARASPRLFLPILPLSAFVSHQWVTTQHILPREPLSSSAEMIVKHLDRIQTGENGEQVKNSLEMIEVSTV